MMTDRPRIHRLFKAALLVSLCALTMPGCYAPCGHTAPMAHHGACQPSGLPAGSILGPLGGCCDIMPCGPSAGQAAAAHEPPAPHSKFHPVPTRPVFAASAPGGWDPFQPSSSCDGCCEEGYACASNDGGARPLLTDLFATEDGEQGTEYSQQPRPFTHPTADVSPLVRLAPPLARASSKVPAGVARPSPYGPAR